MSSKGILAFAQGPKFLKLALIQLTQLRKFSDIGAAYVVDDSATDCPEYAKLEALGATFITANSKSQSRSYDLNVEWKNLGRDRAFELSPWDKTLLVDADFIIQSPATLELLEADLPLICSKWHHCFDQAFTLDEETIGEHAIPMLWATLVWFDKSESCKALFARWAEVLKFLKWRQEYYGFYSSLIRNDYALSIAVHELEQEQKYNFSRAPYSQMVIPPWCTYEANTNSVTVFSTTSDRPIQKIDLTGLDFHALNKTNLIEAML